MRTVGLLSLSLLLTSCSVGRFERVSCEDQTACRDAFGLGSVCSDDGYCDEAPVFARCVTTLPTGLLQADPDDIIVFGTLFDHDSSPLLRDSARLAVVQARAVGGLDGLPLGLVQCDYSPDRDDGLDRDAAIRASIAYLDGVVGAVAVVGPVSSASVLTAWDSIEARDSDMVLISPAATSPALTWLDGAIESDAEPGRLWRTVPPDTLQGRIIASDIIARDGAGVGILYADDPYGTGLRDVLVEQLESHPVVDTRFSSATRIPDILLDFSDDGRITDVVTISSRLSDVVAAVNSWAIIDRLDTRTLYFPDVGSASEVLDAIVATGIEDQVRGTRPVPPDGRIFEAFRASFAAEYRGRSIAPDGFSAYAYDAMWVALYGAAWAHFQGDIRSGDDLSRGIRRLSQGEPVDVRSLNWLRVQTLFEAGEPIDIRGASGELDFDSETGDTTGPIEVWTVDVVGGLPIITREYVVPP